MQFRRITDTVLNPQQTCPKCRCVIGTRGDTLQFRDSQYTYSLDMCPPCADYVEAHAIDGHCRINFTGDVGRPYRLEIV